MGEQITERLEKVAKQLALVAQEERQQKDARSELKNLFLDIIDEEHEGRDYLLPVITIEIPAGFLEKVGLTEEEFLTSRFPGWDLEDSSLEIDREIFILKKNFRYLPKTVEMKYGDTEKIRVSKDVAEYTPEIDWKSLSKEFPELVEAISVPIVTRELEEERFEEELQRNPELLSTLQRHMKIREPQIRVTPRIIDVR